MISAANAGRSSWLFFHISGELFALPRQHNAIVKAIVGRYKFSIKNPLHNAAFSINFNALGASSNEGNCEIGSVCIVFQMHLNVN